MTTAPIHTGSVAVVGDQGVFTPHRAVLTFDPADPHAARLTIPEGVYRGTWEFASSMLSEVLTTAEAGMPCGRIQITRTIAGRVDFWVRLYGRLILVALDERVVARFRDETDVASPPADRARWRDNAVAQLTDALLWGAR